MEDEKEKKMCEALMVAAPRVAGSQKEAHRDCKCQ